jgi:hypothetical protein
MTNVETSEVLLELRGIVLHLKHGEDEVEEAVSTFVCDGSAHSHD